MRVGVRQGQASDHYYSDRGQPESGAIECPRCENFISRHALVCPACGCLLPGKRIMKVMFVTVAVAVYMAVFLAILLFR
jgi:hypothetical protein